MKPEEGDNFDEEEIKKRRKEVVYKPVVSPTGILANLTYPSSGRESPMQQAMNGEPPRLSGLFRGSERESVATTTTFVPGRPESQDKKEQEMAFQEMPPEEIIEQIDLDDVKAMRKKKKGGGIFTTKRSKKPKRKPLENLDLKKSTSRVSGNSGSKLLMTPQRTSGNTIATSNPALDDARSSLTPENRSSNNRDQALSVAVGDKHPLVLSPTQQSFVQSPEQREEQERNRRLQVIILVIIFFGLGIGLGYFIGDSTATPTTIVERVFVTNNPTPLPTISPTTNPTLAPTPPTDQPTRSPTVSPTGNPTRTPTTSPTGNPTLTPTTSPTGNPTITPTTSPTNNPSFTLAPTSPPTGVPTTSPTFSPTASPSTAPTKNPTPIIVND